MVDCRKCIELGQKPKPAKYTNPPRCRKHKQYTQETVCRVCGETFLKRPRRTGSLCSTCWSNRGTAVSPAPVAESSTDQIVDRIVDTGREVSVVNGYLINDVETLKKRIKFDPLKEKIYDTQIKAYQGYMRRLDGKNTQVQMFSISIKIRPNNEQIVLADLKKEMIDEIRKASVLIKTPKIKYAYKSQHLGELGTFELHLGKFVDFMSTGADYNLDIAEKVFTWAFEELLSRCAHEYHLDRILFPIGNDFIHFDNLSRETTHGTAMNESVGTYYGVKKKARQLIDWAIMRSLEVAPIDVIVVPGNHDAHAMYTLGEVLEAKYENIKHVTIDNRPFPRKYYSWGKNMIGLTHGRDEKLRELPIIMPVECEEHSPGTWSGSTFREVHVGHFHHRQKIESLRDYKGIGIRLLPTLSAVDLWHIGKGHIGSIRSGEAYIWHKMNGLSDTKFATLSRDSSLWTK